jgi:4-hydroxy-L-threonine phosphate dehydrogenase PdxA
MRPLLGITMGGPTGIGPEVIVKALARPGVRRLCCPLVIGSGYVQEAVLLAIDRRIAGIVTAPINEAIGYPVGNSV